MKKSFLKISFALLFVSNLSHAQQWLGSNTPTADINRSGKVLIGGGLAANPSAMLNVQGPVEFEGLTASPTAPRFVVCDTKGNLFYKLATSVPNFTCATPNFLTRRDASGNLTCSDLFNGTSSLTYGASSTQGSYTANDRAFEIVSGSSNGSVLHLKAGNDSMFLSLHSNQTYAAGFYLTPTRTFGFFLNDINVPSLQFQTNGNVSIGRVAGPNAYKLAVGGKIIAEELKVQLQSAWTWPDFVFAKDYALPTLADVEKQILDKGHLSGIPSAAEVKANDGIEVGEMNRLLLQKVEELTLYMIEQNKVNEKQAKEIEELKLLVKNANNK